MRTINIALLVLVAGLLNFSTIKSEATEYEALSISNAKLGNAASLRRAAIKAAKKKKKKKGGVSTFNINNLVGIWSVFYPELSESSDRFLQVNSVEPNGEFSFTLFDIDTNFVTFGFGVLKGNSLSFVEPVVGGEQLNVVELSGGSGSGNIVGHISYDCGDDTAERINSVSSPSCTLLDEGTGLFLRSTVQLFQL